MEYGFSVLMLIFGGAILLYALLIGRGNPDLIPRMYAVKTTNLSAFTKEFAKVLAIIGLSPVISGLTGLKYGNKAAAIALFVSLAIGITICWLKHRQPK